MQNNTYLLTAILLIATSCSRNNSEFDATGNFEADEVIISAEASGKIIQLNVEEGTELKSQEVIGLVDTRIQSSFPCGPRAAGGDSPA